MDTRSTVLPLTVSVSTQSSTLAKDFGQKLHRDILAADERALESSIVTANPPAESSTPGKSISVPVATKKNENISEDAPESITEAKRDEVVVSSAVPNPDVLGLEVGAKKVDAQRATETTIVATTPSAPSSLKHGAKKTEPTTSAGVVIPPDAPPSDLTIVARIAEANGTTPAHRMDFPQSLPAETSGLPGFESTAVKPDRPAKTLENATEVVAKPVPGSAQGLASKPIKQTVGAATTGSKIQHDEVVDSLVVGVGASGRSAGLEVASQTANGSHLNQLGAVSALAPNLVPNHPAVSSARDGLQLFTTTAPNATGSTGLHVVPSGPAQLDVGVLDSTHGWLRIRAELGAGGSVSASLTAGALAHESLRAALPEMAKYLGSEAISVTALAVHRFATTTSTTADAATSQQNADTRGQDPRGDAAKDDGRGQKHHAAAEDSLINRSTPTTPSRTDEPESVAVAVSGARMRTLSHGTERQGWPFEILEGMNGSWLNVCA